MPSRPIGPYSQNLGNGIGSGEDIGEADDRQHPLARARYQLEGGVEDGDAGALGADQRAGDVEAVLGQERIEVGVAGDAPRDPGETRADEVAVTPAEFVERAVDLAAAAAGGDDLVQVVVAGRADGHALAVIGEDVEFQDVVGGAPGHDRMDAAGIVADHPAERVVVVGGRVRAEGEVVFLGGVAQTVEDAARLDACAPRFGIEGDKSVQVLGEIDQHRGVAALAGEAGAAAAHDHRGAGLAAFGDGGDDVVDAPGDDDADRHLPVVRGVGGVECAAAAVEADLAGDLTGDGTAERFGVAGHGLESAFDASVGGAGDRPVAGMVDLDDVMVHEIRPPAARRRAA